MCRMKGWYGSGPQLAAPGPADRQTGQPLLVTVVFGRAPRLKDTSVVGMYYTNSAFCVGQQYSALNSKARS